MYILHFILYDNLTNRQCTVVDLKTLNVNTGVIGSESKIESKIGSICVIRGKGKGICILLSTEITWLLNTLFKLIVGSVSCRSGIYSIPLIAVHVNIELGTAGIKSAFLEICSDIYKHRVLCGISIANVLCKEPVVL